jgi:SMC interacting uncharacterized protein involved in chromosome segregation
MKNNHQNRIKNRIKESIDKFKNKEIDYQEFIENISGNINALDQLPRELENAKVDICAELETIFYMHAPKDIYNKMLIEIEKFEKFIDKNL